MKVVVKYEKETACRLQLYGPLIAGQWRQLLAEFEALCQKGVFTVIVDLKDVPLVDGLGLTALIAGYRLFGSDCTRFRLEGLGHQPQLLLQVAGVDWLTGAA